MNNIKIQRAKDMKEKELKLVKLIKKKHIKCL